MGILALHFGGAGPFMVQKSMCSHREPPFERIAALIWGEPAYKIHQAGLTDLPAT